MNALPSHLVSHMYRATPSLVLGAVVAVFSLAGCSKSTDPEPVDPHPSGIAPERGGIGTEVQISGSDFESGIRVWFGDVQTPVERLSSSTLRVHAPEGLEAETTYDVTVVNPGDGTATLEAAYTVVTPELRVVNGVTRPSGQAGSLVILEGYAFGDLVELGAVFFTDAGGMPIEASVELAENWTDGLVVATVPGSAESGPVWIETPSGTSNSVEFTISQSATFSPSEINWTATSALPFSVQGHAAVFATLSSETVEANRIYVTGGADGTAAPTTGVAFADVGATGEVTAWTTAPDLPGGRAFHKSTMATPFNAFINDTTSAGHLYVVGGLDDAGMPTTSVLHATLSTDGELSGWLEDTPLPEPLHSMGVTLFRSWVYVAGGAGPENLPVSSVYRAHVEFDGALGPWEPQTALPTARAYAPLVQFAGALYLVGGDTEAVEPSSNDTGTRLSSIVYSRLDLRTAVLSSSWTANASELIKPVSKHSVIVAGSAMLSSGGIYNGAGSSATEHQYSEFRADYTLGSFSGATGSQTIAATGAPPFYNHSAITYVDGSGAAHVVILGGADVDDASTVLSGTYYY